MQPKQQILQAEKNHERDIHELVRGCIEGNRQLWNEFFIRFTPLIQNTIRYTIGYNVAHYRLDESVEAIYCEVVLKLCKGGILELCPDLSGIKPWLRKISLNETLDWLRARNMLKNIPQTDGEETAMSIDDLVGDGGGRFGDILAFTMESGDCIDDDESWEMRVAKGEKLAAILKKMDALERNKSYWVLRLTMMAEAFLSDTEIDSLAAFAARPVAALQVLVDTVTERLNKKIAIRQKAESQAVLLWYKLRRLEKKHYLAHERLSENMQKIQQDEIGATERLRECHLKVARGECRPSNREIAELLGLPENDADQISVILHRIREKLRER